MSPDSTLPMEVATAIARYRELLRARFGDRLRQVVLYGSYARGDAHEESDVDVFVAIDDCTEAERRDAIDLAWDADRGLWTGLVPLVMPTATADDLRRRERRLLRDIDTEGIPL